jgi:hypothetical protein
VKDGSLLRKDKRRMNFIHAGPFDSALRAPLRMTILMGLAGSKFTFLL